MYVRLLSGAQVMRAEVPAMDSSNGLYADSLLLLYKYSVTPLGQILSFSSMFTQCLVQNNLRLYRARALQISVNTCSRQMYSVMKHVRIVITLEEQTLEFLIHKIPTRFLN